MVLDYEDLDLHCEMQPQYASRNLSAFLEQQRLLWNAGLE